MCTSGVDRIMYSVSWPDAAPTARPKGCRLCRKSGETGRHPDFSFDCTITVEAWPVRPVRKFTRYPHLAILILIRHQWNLLL